MTNQHLIPHPDNNLSISGNTVKYNEQGEKTMFFSEYFKLKVESEKLDFVNIPLDTDLPVYIDPYSISIKTSEWYVECNNLIVDFSKRL